MATILRSSKYVRYLAGFARRLVFNHSNGDAGGNLLTQSQCVTSTLTKSLATKVATQRSQNDSALEKSIHRLDQDVRRMGRISKRDLEEILEEIRTTRSATSAQALLVIRCCGNLVPEELPSARTQLVKQIWKTLENLGIPMDVSHYNALLRVYLENEYDFSPVSFLTELEGKGIEPNRVTYQRLISRYCQQGDIDGATKILEFMREKQLPVNENVFNALIMGHSQANDMESAVDILGVMRQANLVPSADTYTALLCGYAKSGDIESIKRIIAECESKDVLLLNKDLNDVVYSLVRNGHTQYIDEITSSISKQPGYNQDAVNLILRLVNIGQEDIAFKILLSMPKPIRGDGRSGPIGSFYIRQLVKANVPVEKIVEVCLLMEKEGHNHRAFMLALETSLQKGDSSQCIPLLHAWKETGAPIRHHYFWPLIAKQGRAMNNEGIMDVLVCMHNQFRLSLGGETLREYVLPLYKRKPIEILNALKGVGVSPASAANAVVFHLLNEGNIKHAADIIAQYRAHYSFDRLRRPLVTALRETGDVESYVIIVRHILEGLSRKENAVEGPANFADMTGIFAVDIVNSIKKNTVTILSSVLKGFLKEGLGISNEAAKKLQGELGEELTPELTMILSKLTSEILVPKALSKPSRQPNTYSDVTHLKNLIATLESKGESTNGVKRQLLRLYCRQKDLPKVEELLTELDAQEFVYNEGIYAQLIELYCNVEQLEKAEKYMELLMSSGSNVSLDETKIIKYVTLLVKNNRIDDALQFLDNACRDRKADERSYSYGSMCWRLLNSIAEKGDAENLQKMFDVLMKHEYIDVSNIMLGPLIKVHLVRNDLKTALDTFEWASQTHNCTPWKSELTAKLIAAEDAASLQRLTDLSTQIHGEVNSLYDLVLSFVECGRIRQARKILETPGLHTRSRRLSAASERYREEGLVAPLEGLLEATKDIYHINRGELYYNLLLSYKKVNDWEKGLGLWTTMQEEDCQPSDEFLSTLATLLRKNNQTVPFVQSRLQIEDAANQKKQPESEAPVPKATPSSVRQTALQEFRSAIREGDLAGAQKTKSRMEGADEQLTMKDKSSLIEALVRDGQMSEAITIVESMMQAGSQTMPRILKFMLNKIANAGDVETLTKLSSLLPAEMKKFLSFDNRVCHANSVAGKSEEYLNQLEKNLENATNDDLPTIAETFPRGGAVGILEKNPELTEKFAALAKKYAARGIIGPMNVLWAQYFIESKPEADGIWSEYLADQPRVMFKRIIQTAREKNDTDLVQRLLEKLTNHHASDGAKGIIFSCLIDIYSQQKNFDEGLSTLKKAIKEVSLESINRKALIRLKYGLEKIGKSFPYTLPAKNAKNTSSSSSDEENVKHPNKQ